MAALPALVINEPTLRVEQSPAKAPPLPSYIRFTYADVAAALTAFINGIIALLILNLPYFAPVREEFTQVAVYLLSVLAIGFSVVGLAPFVQVFGWDRGGNAAKAELVAMLMLVVAVLVNIFGIPSQTPLAPALALLITPLPLVLARFSLQRLVESLIGQEEGHLYVPVSTGDHKPGSHLEVTKGQEIPCDGLITKGVARIAESRFAGLSEVRIKGCGHGVFAGSRVLDGSISVTIVTPSEDAANTSFLGHYSRSLDTSDINDQSLSWIAWGLLSLSVVAALWWQAQGMPLVDVLLASAAIALAASLLQARIIPILLRRGMVSTLFKRGVLFTGGGMLNCLASVGRVAFWCPQSDQQLAFSAHSFSLEDERLERKKVVALLASLVGHADEPLQRALTRYVLSIEHEPELFELQEYAWFPRYPGIAGSIGGAELSLGTEEFLVARGVHISPHEIERTGSSTQLFLALGPEIVARMRVDPSLFERGAESVELLKESGIRPILFSPQVGEQVDELGRRVGFELANIRGNVKEQDLPTKAAEIAPALLAMPAGIERSMKNAVDGVVRVARFDELICELPGTEVTLFTEDNTVVPALVRAAQVVDRVHYMVRIVLIASIGLLLGAILIGMAAPVVVAAFSCLVVLTLVAVCWWALASIARVGVPALPLE